MSIAIIPARGGSTRIPRKNIRIFHGKPIIAYSIETARASGLFDHIVVSTDDPEIGAIAQHYGAAMLHRPPEFARDEIGTQEVMRHALMTLTPDMRELMYACCIYPTTPMLSPETLRRAFETMVWRTSYVVPVATWLRDPGQFYFGYVDAFIHGEPLLSQRTVMFPIDPATECDINTESDWIKAEQMYLALRGNNGN